MSHSILCSLFLFKLFNPSHALSSHSPPDLLAYPKYSVSLSDWNSAINNLTATSILNSHQLPLQSHGLSVLNNVDSDFVQDLDHARHTLIRTSSGQAFLCKLPPIPSQLKHSSPSASSLEPTETHSDPVDQDRKLEREKIEKEGLQNGLRLISALKDRCIYTRLGWFTYSFCYGKGEIRQFHALLLPGHNHPHEDPNQDVYVLGFHLDHPQNPHHQARLDGTLPASTALAAEGELTSLGRNRFSSGSGAVLGISDVLREESPVKSDAAAEEEFAQKRYLVQRWDGGTICDMTGKPRAVEVQFHCSTVASDHIALLRETSICEYLLVIHTPRLCAEPLFLDGGGRKGLGPGEDVSEIDCRPILTDEEIVQWNASEEARKKKLAQQEARQQEARQQKAIEDQLAAASEKDSSSSDHAESAALDSKSSDSNSNDDQPPPSSEPAQTVLGSSTSSEPTKESTPALTNDDPSKETKAAATGDEEAEVLDVGPITVYFDTDTGQVYTDSGPSGRGVRKTEGGSTGSGDGQAGQAKASEGAARGEEGYENLEQITRALKDSLGALLRDLRATEEGGQQQQRGNNLRVQRPGSLADLVASLKESSAARKARQQQSKSGSGKQQGSGVTWNGEEMVGQRVSEEHKKLSQMYGKKFEVVTDQKKLKDGGSEVGESEEKDKVEKS